MRSTEEVPQVRAGREQLHDSCQVKRGSSMAEARRGTDVVELVLGGRESKACEGRPNRAPGNDASTRRRVERSSQYSLRDIDVGASVPSYGLRERVSAQAGGRTNHKKHNVCRLIAGDGQCASRRLWERPR